MRLFVHGRARPVWIPCDVQDQGIMENVHLLRAVSRRKAFEHLTEAPEETTEKTHLLARELGHQRLVSIHVGTGLLEA